MVSNVVPLSSRLWNVVPHKLSIVAGLDVPGVVSRPDPMPTCSEHRREFVERGGTAKTILSCFDAEFVEAAAQILDERVTFGDHRRGAVGLQSAHRPQPCFQPSVVTFDPVVRILGLVVRGLRQQLFDDIR